MAQRTTTTQVQNILGDHWDGTTSVQPFIDLAVTDVDDLESKDTRGELSDSRLQNIEALLAADYYCLQAPLPTSVTIGKSREDYAKRIGFRDAAKRQDITGNLARFGQRIVAKWLGKRPSAETEYVDRD